MQSDESTQQQKHEPTDDKFTIITSRFLINSNTIALLVGGCETKRNSRLGKCSDLFRMMGTEIAGFFFRPSMMSGALSPYILWMALRWITSDEPPSVLSSRNLACSSADMRDSFRWTVSRALMAARLVSRTTSNYGQEENSDFLLAANQIRFCKKKQNIQLPAHLKTLILTSVDMLLILSLLRANKC